MKQILYNNKIIALIISNQFRENGIHFFTPDDFSQQLAYMCHPAGKKIQPHKHNFVIREIKYTQEVLLIRKGKVRVDLFSDDQEYLESVIIETGDIILLASGGHGFEMLEETEMIEIKQGPYAGENDKTRFESEIRELKFNS